MILIVGVYATVFVLLLGLVGWAAAGVVTAAKKIEREAFKEGAASTTPNSYTSDRRVQCIECGVYQNHRVCGKCFAFQQIDRAKGDS